MKSGAGAHVGDVGGGLERRVGTRSGGMFPGRGQGPCPKGSRAMEPDRRLSGGGGEPALGCITDICFSVIFPPDVV